MAKLKSIEAVGDVVHFDKHSFEVVKGYLSQMVLPAVNDVIDAFKKLSIGPFTQEDYESVCNSNLLKISERYRSNLAKSARKISDAYENVIMNDPKSFEPANEFARLAEKLISVHREVCNRMMLITANLNLSDIRIDNGTPVIMEDEIRERLTIRIISEKHLQFYNNLATLKEAYDNLREFMNDHGKTNYPIFSDSRNTSPLCWEDESGNLVIDPLNFTIELQ